VVLGNVPLRNSEAPLVMVANEALQSKNAIATAFKDTIFQFMLPRLVRPLDAGPAAGNPALRAETLLPTYPQIPAWTEPSLAARPSDSAPLYQPNRKEAASRLSPSPLPVAVMVSESSGPPAMMGGPPLTTKPRLVVFGNASFISNQRVDERSPEEN